MSYPLELIKQNHKQFSNIIMVLIIFYSLGIAHSFTWLLLPFRRTPESEDESVNGAVKGYATPNHAISCNKLSYVHAYKHTSIILQLHQNPSSFLKWRLVGLALSNLVTIFELKHTKFLCKYLIAPQELFVLIVAFILIL